VPTEEDGRAIQHELLIEWYAEGVAKAFHLPDDDGEPLCGAEGDEAEITGPHTCKITSENKGRLCGDCGVGEAVVIRVDNDRPVKSIYVVLGEAGNPLRAFESREDAEEIVERWRQPPTRIHGNIEEIDLIGEPPAGDLVDLGEAEMMPR